MSLAETLNAAARPDGVNFPGANEERTIADDFEIAKGASASRGGPAESE